MTMSAKWTAVSFFALTGLAAGSFAFAGCTVTTTSGGNGEGGTLIPVFDSSTAEDSSTAADSSTTADSGTDSAADSATSTCAGNKQTSGDFVNATCQAKLEAECCAELKGCFNLVVTPNGGASDDCNTYVSCVDLANGQPTQQQQIDAQAECDLGAPLAVRNAYDAIVQCATDKANAECQ